MSSELRIIGGVILLLLASGCGWQMSEQARYEGYEASSTTAGHSSALAPPPGTVPAHPQSSAPPPLTEEMLQRGRQRYEIYCTPCHGRSGQGNGEVVKRGFPAPASFHLDRLRQAEDLHFWSAITNGAGRMYPYAGRISPRDRWAIVGWIRVLQAAEESSLDEMPAAFRSRLLERLQKEKKP